jgi:hypothetical protein
VPDEGLRLDASVMQEEADQADANSSGQEKATMLA